MSIEINNCKLIHGDCIDFLKNFDGKVDVVITDPPYFYNDYSKGNAGFDEKQENKEMGGNDKTHYWEISEKDKTQTARFVRWRLTASSNSGSGSGSLSFSQWEFYGDIVRPLNESDL